MISVICRFPEHASLGVHTPRRTPRQASSAAPQLSRVENAVGILALAIEKAGSTDRTAVRDALREMAGDGGMPILPGEWEKAKAAIAAGEDIDHMGAAGKTAAHLVLPWIHQVFSNLKGWARGVYHGLRRKHLQAYLDEFVFRFNRRKTRHAAFCSLFRIATNAEPLTYNMLIEPEPCA